jgi:hypothetical protein
MNLTMGRSEYPKLAKYIDYDLPGVAYDPVIAKAFERFTAYHPTEKLAGCESSAFHDLLTWGADPVVIVMPPMQPAFPGLTTGIKVARRYADSYEASETIDSRFSKVTGALAGRKDLYRVTGQILAQLVMWTVWRRDDLAKRANNWTWSAETPAQQFLDYLYGPGSVFWT